MIVLVFCKYHEDPTENGSYVCHQHFSIVSYWDLSKYNNSGKNYWTGPIFKPVQDFCDISNVCGFPKDQTKNEGALLLNSFWYLAAIATNLYQMYMLSFLQPMGAINKT